MMDYIGYIGNVDFLLDVVMMNYGYSSYWMFVFDLVILYVLWGWGKFGKGIEYYVDLGEMLVWNVLIDICFGFGMEMKGNLIFVFEVVGFCIGYFGYLYYEFDVV